MKKAGAEAKAASRRSSSGSEKAGGGTDKETQIEMIIKTVSTQGSTTEAIRMSYSSHATGAGGDGDPVTEGLEGLRAAAAVATKGVQPGTTPRHSLKRRRATLADLPAAQSESMRRAMLDDEGAAPIETKALGTRLSFADGSLEDRYRVWRGATSMAHGCYAATFWTACWVAGVSARHALYGPRLAALVPAAVVCILLAAFSAALIAGTIFGSRFVRHAWQSAAQVLLFVSVAVVNYLSIHEPDTKYPLVFCVIANLTVNLATLSFALPTGNVALLSGACALVLSLQGALIEEIRNSMVTWVAVAMLVINLCTWTYASVQLERWKRSEYRRADLYSLKVKAEAARSESLARELKELREQRERERAAAEEEKRKKASFVISQPIERVVAGVEKLRERAEEDGRADDLRLLEELLETVSATASLFVPEISRASADVDDPLLASWLQMEISPTTRRLRNASFRSRDPQPGSELTSLRRRDSAMLTMGRRSSKRLGSMPGGGGFFSSSSRSPELGADFDPLGPVVASLLPEDDATLRALLARSKDWDFDVMELDSLTDGRALRILALHFFHDLGFARTYKLDADKFYNFLVTVDEAYNANWYHNGTHAADVLQAVVSQLASPAIRQHLNDLERLAALLAAVVHDMGHDGRNNNFEIATASERALIYNDRSVLENYHVSRCFLVLRQPECDFVGSLPSTDRRALRRCIVDAVLATDISRHFEMLGAFKAQSALATFGKTGEDRQVVLSALVKCADLANAARPLPIYRRWADWVMQEFYEQGDDEKRLGLPVSPWMDRDRPEPAKCQTGFIDFLVEPLYSAWAAKFPEFQPKLDQVLANRAYWKKVIEQGGEGLHSGSTSPAAAAPISSAPVTVRRRSSTADTAAAAAAAAGGSAASAPASTAALASAVVASGLGLPSGAERGRGLSLASNASAAVRPREDSPSGVPPASMPLIPSIAMLTRPPAPSPPRSIAQAQPPPLPTPAPASLSTMSVAAPDIPPPVAFVGVPAALAAEPPPVPPSGPHPFAPPEPVSPPHPSSELAAAMSARSAAALGLSERRPSTPSKSSLRSRGMSLVAADSPVPAPDPNDPNGSVRRRSVMFSGRDVRLFSKEDLVSPASAPAAALGPLAWTPLDGGEGGMGGLGVAPPSLGAGVSSEDEGPPGGGGGDGFTSLYKRRHSDRQ